MNQHRIVVLGAGYTGMICTLSVARRTRRLGTSVVLVNASDRFVERLRMHQIATDQPLDDIRIPDLVEGTGIEFVQGWVTQLDPQVRTVGVTTPGGERRIDYDTLVYALGSSADTALVPGADEYAYTLNGVAEAKRLAGRLSILGPGARITVCGGGLTGIEAATEIAESYPSLRVELVSLDEPGATMNPKARAYVDQTTARLGIQVRTRARITKVLADHIELASGESVPTEAALWTTGMVADPLATRAGLATDERGRIQVDTTLRSTSHPQIYAIGDAAAVAQSYGILHGTCQSGMPTGAHAAAAIARRLRGKQPKPFRFGYLHQPVSLGRNDAVIQFVRPDDSPGRFYLTGRAAIAYKKFVTASPFGKGGTFTLAKRFPIPGWLLARTGGRRNPPMRPSNS